MIAVNEVMISAPSACDSRTGLRKKFSSVEADRTVSLFVPNVVEEKGLRGLIEDGYNLARAYQLAQLTSIEPYPGLHGCLYDTLRTKGYDPAKAEMITYQGKFTCLQFWACWQDYLDARRRFAPTKGRIRIAEGVYSPAARTEEPCIKDSFSKSGDLRKAYSECGAGDIVPNLSGAIETMTLMLRNTPAATLYDVTKTTYRLAYTTPTPEPPLAPGPEPPAPGVDIPTHAGLPPKADSNMIYYALGAVGLFVIFRKLM